MPNFPFGIGFKAPRREYQTAAFSTEYDRSAVHGERSLCGATRGRELEITQSFRTPTTHANRVVIRKQRDSRPRPAPSRANAPFGSSISREGTVLR